VDPSGADSICIGYLNRTFRAGKEFAERGNTLADCVGQRPPRFGEYSEPDSCCDLVPLDCSPHHFAEAAVLPDVL
jgi:hypothetical protein